VSYYERIRVTAADINRLHARIHETCRHRGRDSASWEQATADFHRYVSPIDALVQRCYAEEFADAPELVNFAVEFLELDPLFFRSGYLKETLLDQLKVAPLTEADKTRLREVLIDAVLRRGRREFRRYCRLAVVLQNAELLEKVRELAQSSEHDVRSRARLMLSYFRNP
jgi:hypothetical protein